MKELVRYIATTLAEYPDEVAVTEGDTPEQLTLQLAPSDVGRIIGRRGRTAKAIRTLLRAVGPFDLEIGDGGDDPEDDTARDEGGAGDAQPESGAE